MPVSITATLWTGSSADVETNRFGGWFCEGLGPESLVTDFAVYPSGGHWLRDASILAAHRMRRGAFNCSAVSGPVASWIRSTVTSGSSGTEIGAAVKPWSAR